MFAPMASDHLLGVVGNKEVSREALNQSRTSAASSCVPLHNSVTTPQSPSSNHSTPRSRVFFFRRRSNESNVQEENNQLRSRGAFLRVRFRNGRLRRIRSSAYVPQEVDVPTEGQGMNQVTSVEDQIPIIPEFTFQSIIRDDEQQIGSLAPPTAHEEDEETTENAHMYNPNDSNIRPSTRAFLEKLRAILDLSDDHSAFSSNFSNITDLTESDAMSISTYSDMSDLAELNFTPIDGLPFGGHLEVPKVAEFFDKFASDISDKVMGENPYLKDDLAALRTALLQNEKVALNERNNYLAKVAIRYWREREMRYQAKKRIETLIEMLGRTNTQFEELEEVISTLRAHRSNLQERLCLLEIDSANFNGKKAEMRAMIRDNRDELEKMNTKISSIQILFRRKNEELKTVVTERNELIEKLDEEEGAKEMVRSLQQYGMHTDADFHAMIKRVETQNCQHLKMQTALEEQKRKIEQLEKQTLQHLKLETTIQEQKGLIDRLTKSYKHYRDYFDKQDELFTDFIAEENAEAISVLMNQDLPNLNDEQAMACCDRTMQYASRFIGEHNRAKDVFTSMKEPVPGDEQPMDMESRSKQRRENRSSPSTPHVGSSSSFPPTIAGRRGSDTLAHRTAPSTPKSDNIASVDHFIASRDNNGNFISTPSMSSPQTPRSSSSGSFTARPRIGSTASARPVVVPSTPTTAPLYRLFPSPPAFSSHISASPFAPAPLNSYRSSQSQGMMRSHLMSSPNSNTGADAMDVSPTHRGRSGTENSMLGSAGRQVSQRQGQPMFRHRAGTFGSAPSSPPPVELPPPPPSTPRTPRSFR